jgi:ABC-type transport system substrate-binding protein
MESRSPTSCSTRKLSATRGRQPLEITHDITPYGEEWRRFGEYVQQQLGKLGIKATLRYEDVLTWLRRIYTNYDYDITNNWIQTLADPVIACTGSTAPSSSSLAPSSSTARDGARKRRMN